MTPVARLSPVCLRQHPVLPPRTSARGAFTEEPRSLVSCAQGVPPHPQVPDEGHWVPCGYQRKAEKAACGTVLWQKLVLSSAAAHNRQSPASDDGTSSSAFQVAWGHKGRRGPCWAIGSTVPSPASPTAYLQHGTQRKIPASVPKAASTLRPPQPWAFASLPIAHTPTLCSPHSPWGGQECPLLAGTASGCRTDRPGASFCLAPARSVPPFPHHPSQPLEETVLASDEVLSSSCLATCQ